MKQLYITTLLLLLSFPAMAQYNNQHQKDSLRKAITIEEGEAKLITYNRLTNLYFAESKDKLKMDTLLTLYSQMDAEAKKQGDIGRQGIVRGNILSAFNNNRMYDEVIRRAPGYIDYLEEKEAWKYYYHCYNTLISAYLDKKENEKAIAEANRLYETAQKRKDDEGMAMALYAMADVYGEQRRFEEVEKCLRECAELLKGNESLISLRAKIWYDLCQNLINQNKLDELPELMREFEKTNERYDEITETQVATSWGNLWYIYAKYYIALAEYDKAEEYCAKIDSIIDSPTYKIMTYMLLIKIYNAQGKYDEALRIIDKHEEMVGPYNTSAANASRGYRIQTLLMQEGRNDILELVEYAAAVNDSIRNTEFAGQIDELRTQYEVDKHIAEKERKQLQLIGITVAAVLLLVILLIYIFYSLRLKQKNLSLYQQIESIRQKEKETEKVLTEIPEENLSKGMLLFRRLNGYIKKEKLFVDSELNRKKMSEYFNTNETYLAEAVREATGGTVLAYLSDLRLQYALELLDKHPEMTFDTIAIDSGYGSYSAFFRAFGKKYGISPSEYRKLSKKK